MKFNILKVFSTDYWSEKSDRGTPSLRARPRSIPRAVDSSYRPYDRGKGQEVSHAHSWQIPYLQQKFLYQKEAWVGKCVDHCADNAASLGWHITTYPEYRNDNDTRLRIAKKLAKAILTRKNKMKKTFRDQIKMIVRDLKIMDAAAIEKVRAEDGRLVGIKVFDAATVKIDIDQTGCIVQYIQELKGTQMYGMYHDVYEPKASANDKKGDGKIFFDPDDVVYINLNPRSDSPYGSSPVSRLVDVIYASVAGDVNLNDYLSTGGVNLGFLTIGQNLDADVVERVRWKFKESQSPGMRFNFPIITAKEDIKWHQMQMTNQEGQMAELKTDLRDKIMAVMSVPPNELGLSGASVRGNVYSQQDVFWGNAIIPMMDVIAEKISEEILHELDPRLKFEFLPPEEYSYESRISRVVTLEKEGLVDEQYKFTELHLPVPQTKTYVQLEKEYSLEQQRMGIEAQKIDLEIKKKTAQYMIEGQQIETEAMKQQISAGNDPQAEEMAKQQFELQNKQLALQGKELEYQKEISEQEYEVNKMNLGLQLKQLSQELALASGQAVEQTQTPAIRTSDVVEAVQLGRIREADLVDMLEGGMISEDQLKEIKSAAGVVKTLSLAKSILNTPKPISGIKETIKPIKPENSIDEVEIESMDSDTRKFQNANPMFDLDKFNKMMGKMRPIDERQRAAQNPGESYMPLPPEMAERTDVPTESSTIDKTIREQRNREEGNFYGEEKERM